MIYIKILHVINSLAAGGAQKLLADILPLMNKEKGIKADILMLTDKNNVFGESLINSSVNLKIVGVKNIYNFLNIFLIKKHIKHGDYDVVHVHLFPSNYWVSISSKLFLKNKPYFVATEHSTHNRRRDKKFFKYIDRYIYSNFDKVFSISDQTQKNLITWLDIKKRGFQRFQVVQNGIDVIKYKNAKPYFKSDINVSFNEDTKLLCMVGRFSHQKDQATLIKTLNKLPKTFHLVLVGEGPRLTEHKNLAKNLRVEDRVHFLGFRADINRILATVDLVILSSNWEGFGLAAVEGMAAGKPVLASNVQGLKEVVNDAGILFSKGKIEDLGEIIKKLLNDSVMYENIKTKCIQRSYQYDIRFTVKCYLEQYYKLTQ